MTGLHGSTSINMAKRITEKDVESRIHNLEKERDDKILLVEELTSKIKNENEEHEKKMGELIKKRNQASADAIVSDEKVKDYKTLIGIE